MKNFIFISCILIILFKTGNVFSDNNIFNVNNIEINKKISKNKEKLVNIAFEKAYDELITRLLLKEDYKKFSKIDLIQIKKLISYYQISNLDENSIKKISVNVFFDKERMHNFFYNRNILYSDIMNTEISLFPLLKKENQYFVYSKNFFYENWNNFNFDNFIEYTLPLENIENIQKINQNKNNIFDLDISSFFKEQESLNQIFAIIEINGNISEVFLTTKIEGKKIFKTIVIEKNDFEEKDYYKKIIFEIDTVIKDLIKSQNLIDVKTPSFLNVEVKLDDKSNLVEFTNRIKKIDLIDNFYVQELNKEYVLVKIKYLGKINKIISKLKNQNINLKMTNGQWQLNII